MLCVYFGKTIAEPFSMDTTILSMSGERGRLKQHILPFGFSGSGDAVNAVLCGKFIELTITPEKIHSGHSNNAAGGSQSKEPESPESIVARSAARSRRTVRRLCNCNNMFFMHTLTFAVSHIKYFKGERPFILVPIEKQKDRDAVIKLWKAFARKLRDKEASKGRYLRYIAVIEVHTGKRAHDTTVKQGCYHIHFVSDRLYNKRQLQHLWQHGLCNHSDWTKGRKKRDLDDTDTLPAPDNPGAYLSKYIGKDGEDVEVGKKRYWASRNLMKPVKLSGTDALKVAEYGSEIYARDRLLVTLDDGTQIHSYTSTRVLPDTKLYDDEYKGCAATPREQQLRKRQLQCDNAQYRAKKAEDKSYEKLHRATSQELIDKAIEGDLRLIKWARREDEAAKLDSERYKKAHRRRISELGERKRKLKRRLLGRKRLKSWKSGHLCATTRVICTSKSTKGVQGQIFRICYKGR